MIIYRIKSFAEYGRGQVSGSLRKVQNRTTNNSLTLGEQTSGYANMHNYGSSAAKTQKMANADMTSSRSQALTNARAAQKVATPLTPNQQRFQALKAKNDVLVDQVNKLQSTGSQFKARNMAKKMGWTKALTKVRF